MAIWKHTLILAIGAILSSASVADSTITRHFEGVDSVRLRLGSADTIVTKGPANEVTVTIEHNYDDDLYRPRLEQVGSRVELREKFTREWHGFGRATWTLTVPDDVRLDASLGSGDFRLRNLSLELDADLGSGNADLADVHGKLDIDVGSGDVELDNASGELQFTAGSGDVTVEEFEGDLRGTIGSGGTRLTGASGEFALTGGSGDIRLNGVNGSFRVTDGSGDISGEGLKISDKSRFNTGSGDVTFGDVELAASASFNTGSGDSRLKLSAALGGDIRLSSGSGDATVDFGGHKIAGDIVMRAGKRNGRISAPFKFDREYEEYEGGQLVMVKEAVIGDEGPIIRISTGSGTAAIDP